MGAFLGAPVALEYLAPGAQLYPAKGAEEKQAKQK